MEQTAAALTAALAATLVAQTPPVTPSPDEVAEVFEAPWDFLMDPANHRRDSLDYQGQTRWFWAMPWRERYIWGATAGIVAASEADDSVPLPSALVAWTVHV